MSTRVEVDHLSLLPNELLCDIFDEAYAESPSPREPLSKRLLPFFERKLYHRVSLSSFRQLDSFLEAVSGQPTRGALVAEFELGEDCANSKLTGRLERLFPLLSNLQHLGIAQELYRGGSRFRNSFATLNVESVTIKARLLRGNRSIDWTCFNSGFLNVFTSLSTLTIIEWRSTEVAEPMAISSLPRLTTLRIKGPGAIESSVGNLIKACPSLRHFELVYPESLTVPGSTFSLLPTTLESIKLEGIDSYRDLQRFQNLRSLDLGKECYHRWVHEKILQLPSLVSLRLGPGHFRPSEFTELVSGPSRLLNLKRVTLDFDVGHRGKVTTDFAVSTQDSSTMNDWILPASPHYGLFGPGSLHYGSIRQCIEVAESNGVRIEGTIHGSLATTEDYWIERNNRAVVSLAENNNAHQYDHLNDLREIRTTAAYEEITLPSLDLEFLDLSRLEIVKIDLPARDWFVLNLRNKGEQEREERKREWNHL
ncbi:uncharacterized protein JCM6883_002731 [Sporobolomyces salmoneus]|uniref:uncharacterized protein n=1 Tax=Sporobolomyces salmoneus TaxID=183962 RepID=UPI003176E089